MAEDGWEGEAEARIFQSVRASGRHDRLPILSCITPISHTCQPHLYSLRKLPQLKAKLADQISFRSFASRLAVICWWSVCLFVANTRWEQQLQSSMSSKPYSKTDGPVQSFIKWPHELANELWKHGLCPGHDVRSWIMHISHSWANPTLHVPPHPYPTLLCVSSDLFRRRLGSTHIYPRCRQFTTLVSWNLHSFVAW